jgi:hypothetical protein
MAMGEVVTLAPAQMVTVGGLEVALAGEALEAEVALQGIAVVVAEAVLAEAAWEVQADALPVTAEVAVLAVVLAAVVLVVEA